MKPTIKILLLCIICVLLLINTAYCQAPKMSASFLKQKDWGFLPNRGQLANEHGDVLTDIKYYGHQGGVYLYCRPGKLSFVFTKVEKGQSGICEATGQASLPKGLKEENHENDKIYTSRADMVLIGANPNAQIIATGQQEYYENYYLAHTTMKGITNVHAYKTLTYQNIYPHIDLVLHSCTQGIKYEYVVHPGGKVSDIQMQWYGLNSAELMAKGGISYSMRQNKNKIGMKESAPVSFTDKGKVVSSFMKKGNWIGFQVGKYDGKETLTIDPSVEWGTYFGDSSGEGCSSIKVDGYGNAYMTGSTASIHGIATTGAFQTSLGGTYDVFLVKYNKYGSLLWSTYYGGKGNDNSYGMACDTSANIYVSGTTYSSGLASSGAYLSYPPGNGDAFLAKFSDSGILHWATYFGGQKSDNVCDLATDKSGNVYMFGTTLSTSGIAIGNVGKTSYSGYEDGFLAKFNSSGYPIWCTYYGGNNTSRAQGIAIDASDNIFITGFSYATDIASSGAYQSTLAGSQDAFIARFSSSGAMSWSTYFGGIYTDTGNKISTDASGNIYIAGNSLSTGLATSGAYQTKCYITNDDVFLACFSGAGALKWCTYLGNIGGDFSTGICTYLDQYVYICGYTNDSIGIASKGAYQSSFGGGAQDGFIAKFKTDGSLVWSSYYGGKGADGLYSIDVDSFDHIYFGGYTVSQNGIANYTGHQKIMMGQGDAFLVKFYNPFPNDAGIDSIQGPTGQKCAGTMAVNISLKNYGTKTLRSTKIGWNVNGVVQKVIQWTGSLAPGASTPVTLGSIYLPAGSNIISVYTIMPNSIIDSVPENDTFIIKFKLKVSPSNAWSITNNGANYYFNVQDSSLNKFYYLWQMEDGFSYNGYSFTHSFPQKKAYKIQLITTNLLACVNEHDTTIDVTTPSGISPGTSPNPYNISIYPNPFHDKTIIHFNNPKATPVKVNVMDMLGKVLYSASTKQYGAGLNEIEFNSSDIGLQAGTYFIGITIDDKMMVKKMEVMGR